MPTPARTMRHRLICRLLLASLLLCCAALAAQAQPADAVTAARLGPGERLVLDGSLSHPAWQRAAVFSQFIEKDPHNGAAPPQRTQVQVLYDEDAVWVGITAFDDQTARIRDVPVRYDGVNRTQDFVVVYVDPIGTKRSAQFFRVSAAGSLADGLHTAADDSEDFAPDFDWDAAVQRRADGWTAVLRLPFASLRFAEGEQAQPWRFMVARRLPREQFHLIASVPIPRDAHSFIDTLQPLQGVQLPQRHGFLTLRPSLTLRQAQEQGDGRSRHSSSDIDASLDLKWRPHAELVIDATLNPDFSQVALDVPQLAGNTRFALSLAEKRPFFFESADLLRSPTEAFYTRSITAPRWGLRGTWRGPMWAGSVLAVDDRGGGRVLLPDAYGTGDAEQPASRALAARVRKDEGGLQWGGVLAARRYADEVGDNLVLGPDLGLQISEAWRLRAQWLASHTTALSDGAGRLRKGPAVEAHRLFVKAQRLVDDGESVITLDDVGSGFRHDGGFVNQAGIRSISLFQSHGWRPVGPFNEFFINVQADQVRDRRTGQVIKELIRPGFWSSAARNLEWWTEFHLHSRVRPTPNGPLLSERYVLTGLVMTPAEWFPLIDANVSVGRLADNVNVQVRPGVRLNLLGRLRLIRSLELEPSFWTAWLRDGGRRSYSETATQLLAVWHFNAQHNLRAIVQRNTFDRVASLTYTWRRSSGTVLYLGASRAQEAGGPSRSSEAFLKLQFDVDEARRSLF